MKPHVEGTYSFRNGAFWVSGSSLLLLQKCPVAAYYGWYCGLTTREESASLRFGAAFHAALAAHYAAKVNRPLLRKKLPQVISAIARNHLGEVGEVGKDAETLVSLYSRYRTAYEFYDFVPPSNWNTVELRFGVPLGTAKFQGTVYPVIWNGRIDLIAHWDNGTRGTRDLWVVDHKTTGQQYNTAAYEMDPSLIGYVWAARQMGVEVAGYLVNQIYFRSTKTGLSASFNQYPYYYNEDIEGEVLYGIKKSVQGFLTLLEEGELPMFTKNCTFCAFLPVCREQGEAKNQAVKVCLKKR